MIIIGLTGQTGAGKSTVAGILKEYGAVHIDADKIAKAVILTSETVLTALKNEFGKDIMKDGILDRKTLAKRAFSSVQKTVRLNEITHPAVNEAIKKILMSLEKSGAKAAVIDAIALFESGENGLCDYTVAVVAPKEERARRIIERDNLTEEQAKERINAQKDESFYTEKCDFTVQNFGEYDIREQLKDLTAKLS